MTLPLPLTLTRSARLQRGLLLGLLLAAGSASAQMFDVQPLSTGASGSLTAVQFLDEEEGFIAGSDATLLHTTDGGESWERIDVANAPPDTAFNGVHFINSAEGWVSAIKLALRTRDGGFTWQGKVNSGPADRPPFFSGVHALSPSVAWFAGAELCTSEPLKQQGLACATLSRFAYDAQGVLRISVHQPADRNIFNDLFLADAANGFAVGSAGTLYRIGDADTDMRITLERQTAGVGVYLNDLFALDAKTAWVVGEGGVILHTEDGASWRAQDSGVQADLEDVFFFDAEEGWAVGSSGTVLQTLDGGERWTAVPSSVRLYLTAIAFPSRELGFVVGASGTALRLRAQTDEPDAAADAEPSPDGGADAGEDGGADQEPGDGGGDCGCSVVRGSDWRAGFGPLFALACAGLLVRLRRKV